MLPNSNMASKTKVRQKRLRPERLRDSTPAELVSSGIKPLSSSGGLALLTRAIRDEHVAHAPHGLNVSRRCGVLLN